MMDKKEKEGIQEGKEYRSETPGERVILRFLWETRTCFTVCSPTHLWVHTTGAKPHMSAPGKICFGPPFYCHVYIWEKIFWLFLSSLQSIPILCLIWWGRIPPATLLWSVGDDSPTYSISSNWESWWVGAMSSCQWYPLLRLCLAVQSSLLLCHFRCFLLLWSQLCLVQQNEWLELSSALLQWWGV